MCKKVYNNLQTIKPNKKYQKWMKTRPRLKALDIYETGYDTIKGSPNRICRTIHQVCGNEDHIDHAMLHAKTPVAVEV